MNNEYDIGDRVYFNLPDGEPGIVLDWMYKKSTNDVEYLISFGPMSTHWCTSEELSKEKTVI